jgi:hypothetical protein
MFNLLVKTPVEKKFEISSQTFPTSFSTRIKTWIFNLGNSHGICLVDIEFKDL